MPFLTESEIGKILKGSDVWMDSDEIRRRLTRMQRAKPSSRQLKKKAAASVEDVPQQRMSVWLSRASLRITTLSESISGDASSLRRRRHAW